MQDDNRKNCMEPRYSLARPYINRQVYTKMYSLPKAFQRGTLFPELYLIDSPIYNKNLYSTPLREKGGRE